MPLPLPPWISTLLLSKPAATHSSKPLLPPSISDKPCFSTLSSPKQCNAASAKHRNPALPSLFNPPDDNLESLDIHSLPLPVSPRMLQVRMEPRHATTTRTHRSLAKESVLAMAIVGYGMASSRCCVCAASNVAV